VPGDKHLKCKRRLKPMKGIRGNPEPGVSAGDDGLPSATVMIGIETATPVSTLAS
jgi:hypothetical protein